MYRKKLNIGLLTLLLLWNGSRAFGQTVPEVNAYIQYVNLSIHGMNEIHRHLHVLNEELLRVQENPSYKINRSLIAELPVALFKDPSFSEYNSKTPEQIFDGIQLAQHSDFKRSLSNIKYVCDLAVYELNIMRRFLLKKNIRDGNNLNYMMAKLGQFEKIYEEFFTYRAVMHRVLLEWSYRLTGEKKYEELYDRIKSIYIPVSDIVLSIKYVPEYLPDDDLYILHKNFREFLFSRMLIEEDFDFKNIKELLTYKMGLFIKDAADYLELKKQGSNALALQYQYYNTIMTQHTNLSYSGFLDDINEMIIAQSFHVPLLLEYPRYFKMSYDRTIGYSSLIEPPTHRVVFDPNDIPEEIETVVIEKEEERGIKGPTVLELPETVKDRKVKKSTVKMSADAGILKLRFYDHILLDGDRISLNFNGDWILEDHSLESKPVELELQLNKEGMHYLLIHAVNVGSKPPNTVGIEYELDGETYKKLLQSDMDSSEMIQIEVKHR